jgi:hypothetical protein
MTKTCPDCDATVLSPLRGRELAEAGLRHAEGLLAQLAKPDWKPSRSHIEQARNSIKKLAELIISTPAAGGEALKDARIALCERLVKYSDDIHCIAVHRDLANDLREAEACITLLTDAAQPPSPLRGREALAAISRAVYRIREWAKNEGPYSEFIKEAAIIERRIEQIALSSAPAEQPTTPDKEAKT